MQLPSLTFPSHPCALALVPDTPAMEEQEASATAIRGAIAHVQAHDAVHRGGQQLVITGKTFTRCVRPVREQRKTQVPVGIGQIVDLQSLDLLVDCLLGGEQRRHDHDRSQVFRYAVT